MIESYMTEFCIFGSVQCINFSPTPCREDVIAGLFYTSARNIKIDNEQIFACLMILIGIAKIATQRLITHQSGPVRQTEGLITLI